MVFVHQRFVCFNAGLHFIGQPVGGNAVLFGVQMVAPGQDPHLHQIGRAARREVDQRDKSAQVLLRAGGFQRITFGKDMLRNLQHFLRLAVMGRVVGVLPHLLVLSAGQQAGVVGDDALNAGQVRRCKSRAKVAAHPLCGVLGGNGSILPAPGVNIISQVQEVGKPELLRANITDVRYPDLPHAVFVSGGHLLPHFGQVGGTHPFK